ncbi:hypothetical protein M758_1G120600 [Ceratodon purpureus]|nr:hypothetical protein M758_1G120400 [Ceratodon purpureus]KAG0629665.1 hypothetical protein M758_1G120600 [Ceratodon purpureus]
MLGFSSLCPLGLGYRIRQELRESSYLFVEAKLADRSRAPTAASGPMVQWLRLWTLNPNTRVRISVGPEDCEGRFFLQNAPSPAYRFAVGCPITQVVFSPRHFEVSATVVQFI